MHRPEDSSPRGFMTPDAVERCRECLPGDEVRRCDCNRRKGHCHCDDDSCDGWNLLAIDCRCFDEVVHDTSCRSWRCA